MENEAWDACVTQGGHSTKLMTTTKYASLLNAQFYLPELEPGQSVEVNFRSSDTNNSTLQGQLNFI